MASLFTRIIQGDIPGRFLWRDDTCVAFLTIGPIRPGHTLVVPIQEVDHWVDLPQDLAMHLFAVAQVVGQAQMAAFSPARVGLIIAGMEVPHTHLHVIPIRTEADLDFVRADPNPSPASLDAAADVLRAALVAAGHAHVVTA